MSTIILLSLPKFQFQSPGINPLLLPPNPVANLKKVEWRVALKEKVWRQTKRESLVKHEQKFNMNKVQIWRVALEEVGIICGLAYKKEHVFFFFFYKQRVHI